VFCLINLSRRLVFAVGGLLVWARSDPGNIVRSSHRESPEEIANTSLLEAAMPAFAFLYTGLWYGVGGVFAALLVGVQGFASGSRLASRTGDSAARAGIMAA
jgi:hypothetical protein